MSIDEKSLLEENKVILEFLPAYSSHVLQSLDVLVFHAFKHMEIGINNISDDNVVNDINVILNKIQRTFIFNNIVNAFEQVGNYNGMNEQTIDRKNFIVIDTTKITEKKS